MEEIQFASSPASRAHANFLEDPDLGMLNLEAHRLAPAIAKRTLDETISELHRRLQTDNHPPSKSVTGYISKTNSPSNGASNGDLDTELSELSMTDTIYT